MKSRNVREVGLRRVPAWFLLPSLPNDSIESPLVQGEWVVGCGEVGVWGCEMSPRTTRALTLVPTPGTYSFSARLCTVSSAPRSPP